MNNYVEVIHTHLMVQLLVFIQYKCKNYYFDEHLQNNNTECKGIKSVSYGIVLKYDTVSSVTTLGIVRNIRY